MMRLYPCVAVPTRSGRRAGDPACPVCGAGSGAPVAFTLEGTASAMDRPIETEYCPGCGRMTQFTITLDGMHAGGVHLDGRPLRVERLQGIVDPAIWLFRRLCEADSAVAPRCRANRVQPIPCAFSITSA